MKKSFVLAVLSLLGFAPGAGAADLSMKAPLAPLPIFNWTGFYAGVNVGGGFNAGSTNVTAVNTEIGEGLSTTDQQSFGRNGAFGGGQIGYNWQFQPRWVAGVEADIQGADIRASGLAAAPNPLPINFGPDGGASVNAIGTSKLDWFGTIRARLGYAILDQTLLYATGGFAFGGVKDTLSVTELSEGLPLGGAASSSRTATGYTVGGGLEQFFTASWSLKAEYQYVNLGSSVLSALAVNTTGLGEGPVGTPDCCDLPTGTARISHAYHMLHFGVNYKFGGY